MDAHSCPKRRYGRHPVDEADALEKILERLTIGIDGFDDLVESPDFGQKQDIEIIVEGIVSARSKEHRFPSDPGNRLEIADHIT